MVSDGRIHRIKNFTISQNSSTFAPDLKKMVLLTSDNTPYPELKEKRHETRRLNSLT